MITLIMVGVVVVTSCAFGIYAAMHVETKKNKSHKHV